MESTHPSVDLQIGDKAYRLVFDFNAQAIFEEITGATIDKLFAKKGNAVISSRYTRALLFSQLLHHDPAVQFDEFGRITVPPVLNMQQVGALITRGNMTEVHRKVVEAVVLFYKPAQKENTGTAPNNGTAPNAPSR
ncbi:MAG TPA: hypothetical protein VGK36_08825 [Candidatus Angelobacter sp.]|jgi:hypothetical protein